MDARWRINGPAMAAAATLHPMIRNLKVLFALVLTMVGLTFVTATPAQAATGCGAVCDGQDPQNYYASVGGTSATCGFDPGVWTVDSKYSQYNWAASDYIELRYSPRCRTIWGRAGISNYLQDIVVYSYNSNGTLRKTVKWSNAPWYQAWSPMLNDAGYTGKACLIEYTNYDEQGNNSPFLTHACTKKF